MIELKCKSCGRTFKTHISHHLVPCPNCKHMVSPDHDRVPEWKKESYSPMRTFDSDFSNVFTPSSDSSSLSSSSDSGGGDFGGGGSSGDY